MNIVQEEERRVAGKAPKPAEFRRTRVQSIPRWAYVLFAVLAVLVLLRTFQRGVGTLRPAQAPARPVTVAKVVTKDVPLYLDEIGTCAAYETVLVQAQVSGQIITRDFQDGADVKKGDPLFTIDPRPFQAVLDQDKAQAALDQVNLKRQEDLRARTVISQQDYDTAVANAQKSQAAVEAAQVNVDFCYIKSPIKPGCTLDYAAGHHSGFGPDLHRFHCGRERSSFGAKISRWSERQSANLPAGWFDSATYRRSLLH